jgi:3-hydroxyisobutyrate dehydrogenase-like beta-hydroxyacid dehydrogenase
MTDHAPIALMGLGEVGASLASHLLVHRPIAAWDIQFFNPRSNPARSLMTLRVRPASDCADAVANADLVISAVTANQTIAAAEAAARVLAPGAWFFDLNSSSPTSKSKAAALINAAGGRYVEAAVMSPFGLKRCASPILLGGPHAEAFLPYARDLGFSGANVFASEYGKASAAKLCRSIMIKGIEALLIESLVTARHHGVDEAVLHSLSDLLPGADWPELAHYMIARAIQHGRRRAEEMNEAARMVSDVGLAPFMSGSCAGRQTVAPQFTEALKEPDLAFMLDAILLRVSDPAPTGVTS